MQISAADLAHELKRGVAPLYVVYGDEPLLVIEAGDQIRAAARGAGCDDREVLVVEPGFKWEALLGATRNLGLFGGRRSSTCAFRAASPGSKAPASWKPGPRRPRWTWSR